MTRALIADDEPLLRNALEQQLAQIWPELEIVVRARNGSEAADLFETERPDICFLDIQMPGLSGLEVAQRIGRRAHVIFVTAYEHYAVKAFEAGVLDYLVKPVEPARLAEAVTRIKQRMANAAPVVHTDALLQQLIAKLDLAAPPTYLRWVRAQVGPKLRLIPVEDIDFFRSDDKYTRVTWRNEAGLSAEALVRTALKDIVEQLDPSQFVQVHRSAAVNLAAISHILRGDNETATIYLKGHKETLPVSRAHSHLFRQM